MSWQQLTVTTTAPALPELEELLFSHGCQAITLLDGEDQPILEPLPGETPLWHTVTIQALFDRAEDLSPLMTALHHESALLNPPELANLEDQAWERAWLAHFKPMRFGKHLWVCPTAYTPPDPEAVNLLLDPGLAFGTGTHPTTHLCLEFLAQADLTELVACDYGCGSGILALAALKLGAKQIDAIDIDPQALIATRTNARQNHIPDGQLTTFLPHEAPTTSYDLVMANILSGPLVTLAPTLIQRLKTGGRLVLSGLLSEQIETVTTAYQAQIVFETPMLKDDWACLIGRKFA